PQVTAVATEVEAQRARLALRDDRLRCAKTIPQGEAPRGSASGETLAAQQQRSSRQRSVVPDGRYRTKDLAGDRHTGDGRGTATTTPSSCLRSWVKIASIETLPISCRCLRCPRQIDRRACTLG